MLHLRPGDDSAPRTRTAPAAMPARPCLRRYRSVAPARRRWAQCRPETARPPGRCLKEPTEEPRGSGNQSKSASAAPDRRDRKSTRLNSSHVKISYAVFCLKKKKKQTNTTKQKEKKMRTQ